MIILQKFKFFNNLAYILRIYRNIRLVYRNFIFVIKKSNILLPARHLKYNKRSNFLVFRTTLQHQYNLRIIFYVGTGTLSVCALYPDDAIFFFQPA